MTSSERYAGFRLPGRITFEAALCFSKYCEHTPCKLGTLLQGNGPAIMLIAVVGAVCVAVAALGRKVKKEREMATWH